MTVKTPLILILCGLSVGIYFINVSNNPALTLIFIFAILIGMAITTLYFGNKP